MCSRYFTAVINRLFRPCSSYLSIVFEKCFDYTRDIFRPSSIKKFYRARGMFLLCSINFFPVIDCARVFRACSRCFTAAIEEPIRSFSIKLELFFEACFDVLVVLFEKQQPPIYLHRPATFHLSQMPI